MTTTKQLIHEVIADMMEHEGAWIGVGGLENMEDNDGEIVVNLLDGEWSEIKEAMEHRGLSKVEDLVKSLIEEELDVVVNMVEIERGDLPYPRFRVEIAE